MANIFDYMAWRDLDLEKVEFNEIDNLILARLSYFPFDNIVEEEKEISIKDAYKKTVKNGTTGRTLQAEDNDLYPILANSVRFGNLKITGFVNKLDPIAEKQFAAITVILPNDTIYVSYRGTDNTIVGWKEDFNMSFSDLVASQTEAVKYLENIAKRYPNKQILVGGHSKGGNLAIYASVFCNDNIQKRIIKVYNNDGPGFSDKIVESPRYAKMIKKVHTYIPQTSIIGMLLNHKEATTIIKSTQIGIMQHDLYTWQVLGDKFITAELTNSSKFIDKRITNWLREVSPEQRSEFFDVLFEILNSTKAKTLSEVSSNLFSSTKAMVTTYKNLSPESKKVLAQTLRYLGPRLKENKNDEENEEIKNIK